MNKTLKVFFTPWLLLITLFMAYAMQQSLAENQPEQDGILVGQIDYWFVGQLGQTDGEDRLLVWEAEIEGEVSGTMKWWFINPPVIAAVTTANGSVSYYAARWEVWTDDHLLLAGESAGKTVFVNGADGIWDGHGRVTEAAARFEHLLGRQIYETGPVIIGSDPPRSFKGTGAFVVY